MTGVTARDGGERHTPPVTTAVCLAALIPGDPLATAARRIQDALASAGLGVAHALPPLVPVAIRGAGRDTVAAPELWAVLTMLQSACFAEDLDTTAAIRAEALRCDALPAVAPPAVHTRVVLPLAQPGALGAAIKCVESDVAGRRPQGPSGDVFGKADSLLLAPSTPGGLAPRAVGEVQTESRRRDSPGTPGKAAVITSRRWHAALLSIEYTTCDGASSWAWELLSSCKLRRWQTRSDV